MSKRSTLLAVAVIAVVVLGGAAYLGFGFSNFQDSEKTSQTSPTSACKAGPYEFTEMKLGTTSLTATIKNGANESVSLESFRVSLGTYSLSAVQFAAPSSAWVLEQSIDSGQTSTVEFSLKEKWLIAPGAHPVKIEATTRIGVVYKCFTMIRSSDSIPVRIVVNRLIVDKNESAILDFTIENGSDGTLTGGVVCYAKQRDCLDGATVPRFAFLPARSSLSMKSSHSFAGIESKDWIIFSLVLEAGVVYLFPALVPSTHNLP